MFFLKCFIRIYLKNSYCIVYKISYLVAYNNVAIFKQMDRKTNT